MIFETKVIKQGNSNVIVLPKKSELKPKDHVKVLVIPENVSTVNDVAGLFKEKLKKLQTDKILKKVKKELWGE